MIFGIVAKNIQDFQHRFPFSSFSEGCFFQTQNVFLGTQEDAGLRNDSYLYISKDKESALLFEGEIFEFTDQQKAVGNQNCAEALWNYYLKFGEEFISSINGTFSIAIWDGVKKKLLLIRDHIGVRQIFYTQESETLLFSSSLKYLTSQTACQSDIHLPALYRYLLFCYNPGQDTFFKGIQRLRPAHFLQWQSDQVQVKKYWPLSFLPDASLTQEDVIVQTRQILGKAVQSRINPNKRTGVFLSGGLDSSTMVSLLHQNQVQNIHTFSFRCKGETFDESRYAKIVADHFQTSHHLVEYSPDSVFLAQEMTSLMEEPFCDIGINIATYLLAGQAKSVIRDLYTGDGGDELFAGHPVYLADKMAGLIDWAPRWLFSPFMSLGRKLPDSEKKNDWKVKIKRFSESYSFPKALGTHRWRAYYLLSELSRLLNPDLVSMLVKDDLFQEMISYNQESDVDDTLGRSLYSDYQTVVQFYLRRLDLARSMGLNPKCPMLDYELVRFYGSVPSNIKKPDYSDSKKLEKAIIEPWLPHEIVYRKDKLGHSIPLKNWMRDHEGVQSFFLDWLSAERIQKRGYFNHQYIQQMIDEHMQRKRNHSHRLWALVVLELWMEGV